MVQGVDPQVREAKKPGFFSRLLSGLGRVLGAVAMPLSFIFPPAAIGAAVAYGGANIGDQMQMRVAQRQMEKQQREQQTQVSFPGLEVGGPAVRPASGIDYSASDEQVMGLLFQRNELMNQTAHAI